MSRASKSSLGEHRLSRRSLDHALERRRDDAGDRDRAAGGDDGIRPGRRHHRLGAGRHALGFQNVISFDMGGTTAKASLVKDGEPTMAPGYYVGGYASGHPVMLPMIDVVEVGAGGGIDRLDRRGRRAQGRPAERRRRSGPDLLPRRRHRADHHRRQCRARPARPGQFPRRRDEARRRRAPRSGIEEKIAKPLGMTLTAAAQAILEIAIAKMSLAVREVSVEKGYDPRDFALVASGGAGPLHSAPSRANCISRGSSCRCSRRIFPRSACCWPTNATTSSAPLRRSRRRSISASW